MFAERIKHSFTSNEPIFTAELQRLFPDVQHANFYRMLQQSVDYGVLAKIDRGVYCLPAANGRCGIKAEDVARKRFLGWGDKRYGIFCGRKLIGDFGASGQASGAIDIVTNNDTSRGRLVTICGTKYIVKKSRCEITPRNAYAYMLVQLFDDMQDGETPDEQMLGRIQNFIRRYGVSREQVLDICGHFTARPKRKLETCGILGRIA